MLIRAVAAGWQQRTVMNIQLEKAFNEIKKVKQEQEVKEDRRGELCTPRTVEYTENSQVQQKRNNSQLGYLGELKTLAATSCHEQNVNNHTVNGR